MGEPLATGVAQVLPVQILFASPTTDFLMNGALLALTLLIAAGIVAVVGRWTKGPPVCIVDPHEELTRFRLLRDQGQLSGEEFERIRKLLQTEIRARLGDNPTQEELERAGLELTPIVEPPTGPTGPNGENPPPTASEKT